MHPQNILARTLSLSLLTTLTAARITSITVPSSIAPGSPIPITLQTEDYIQPVQDIAIAFGLTPSATYMNGTLGTTLLGSLYLGPSNSNILTNISYTLTIPADIAIGAAAFTGALFSLYGDENERTVEDFVVSVTVGDETNEELVSSVGYN